MNIKFDSAGFREQFAKRVARSKKTLPVLCNSAGYRIVRRALVNVKRADKAEIARLGVSYITHGKSGKQLKKAKAVVQPTSQFKLIALGNMWRRGQNPRAYANRAALDDAIKKQLGARMRSVGYLAAGFLPAVRKLVRFFGGTFKNDVSSFGPPKGSATPAVEGWKPVCTFENWAGLNGSDQSPESENRVQTELERVLGESFDAETREMQAHAEKELNKTLQGD